MVSQKGLQWSPLGIQSRKFRGINKAILIEALAGREAVQLSLEKGFTSIALEGNSQSIINMLSGHRMVDQSVAMVVQDILNLCHGFSKVLFRLLCPSGFE
ncbi:hypothetical protein LOK49_LG05G02796 [Camellia lanceoleosa]|uniref:Uncharacterized protein n=1 Tax=Camellia lanceoleosa TaxID=1840588 RepID=A0ACC0HL07_9ERIC|nr:hypothetical protein LOK49_LG05G02796 [Camellia lanceoleosa]